MSNCNMLSSKDMPLDVPLDSVSFKYTSGAALFSVFNFAKSPPQSLTNNLNLVFNSKLSDITLVGFFGDKSKSTIVFTAKVPKQLLSNAVSLDNIGLTYYPSLSQDHDHDQTTPTNAFNLTAACTIKFSESSSWLLDGHFTVFSDTAQFSFKPQKEPVTLKETLELKMSNIEFSGRYTSFTNVTPQLSLSGNIDLGQTNPASVSITFDSGIPEKLLVQANGELLLSNLISKLFGGGDTVPQHVVDIPFSSLSLYYAWKSTQPYKAGLHADAKSSVFGMDLVHSD